MSESFDTVILIPARKGSTRCPGKNTRLLKGKNLVERTLDVAQGLCDANLGVHSVLLLTNDPELDYPGGKDLRVIPEPDFLGQECSTEYQFLYHVFKDYPSETRILLLYPTTPFRTLETVKSVIGAWQPGLAVRTVKCCGEPPMKLWKPTLCGDIVPYEDAGDPTHPRQFSTPLYMQTPVAYFSTVEQLLRDGGLWSNPTVPYLVSEKEGFDINTEFDFQIAEALLRHAS